MSDPASRDALLAALEHSPEDTVTVNALADWYEEQGDDAAAACLRWAARHGRRPGYNPGQRNFGKFFWEREEATPIIDDPPAQLPESLWLALAGNDEKYPVYSFKSYRTIRVALADLIAAWKLLPSAAPCPASSAEAG